MAAAARRRQHHPWRAAVTAASPELLPEALRRAADSHSGRASRAASTPQRLGFIYSGQAGQWAGMGVGLAEKDALVRDELLAWDGAITAAGGRR